jgi:hypothetical protein
MHVNARHKHLASHGRLEGNLKQRLIDCYLPRPSPSGRRRNSVGFFELERESARVVHQHFSHHTDRLARTLAPPTCSTVSNSFRCALLGVILSAGQSVGMRFTRQPVNRGPEMKAGIKPPKFLSTTSPRPSPPLRGGEGEDIARSAFLTGTSNHTHRH